MSTRLQELEKRGLVDFTRQKDWMDPTDYEGSQVTLVGAGGIGSPAAFVISKMGIEYLTIIDKDMLEYHNAPSQLYPLHLAGHEPNEADGETEHTGQKKAETLAKLAELFGTAETTGVHEWVQDAPEFVKGIVVTGLDSMDARHKVWKIAKENPQVSYLIDARIGGLDIVIHSIDVHNKDDIEYYENAENATLFKDEDGIEAPCTARAMMDVGFLTAGMIGRAVRHRLTGKVVYRMISMNVETMEVAHSKR